MITSRLTTAVTALTRYTKTDMKYFLGQSSWLLCGQLAIFISSLTLVWFFANHIEPADYGLYKYVLSLAVIATTLSLTGYGVAVAKAISEGYAVDLLKILKIRFRYGFLGTMLFMSIGTYYWYHGNMLLCTIIVASALAIPFYETLSDYQFVLQGHRDFKRQALTRTFQRCLLVIGIVGVILVTHNIIYVTLAFFVMSIISQGSALFYTLHLYPPTNDTKTPYQTIRTYANHLSIQNIFSMTVSQIDKVLLFKLLGPATFAGYFFAIAIPQEIYGFIGNLSSVAFPKLANRTSPEFKRSFLKKVTLLSIILIIPVVGYSLAAPTLFSWLFPRYVDMVFVSQLFVGTILFSPLFFCVQYFYATGHTRASWALNTLSPLLYLTSLLILTPLFGLMGVVAATYLRYSSDLVISLFFLSHHHQKQ